jgi:hypothetical protein
MTPYEMADLAQSNFSNSIAAVALYITLVFAYLAAAYFVGKDLSRSQVTILNALFLTFSVLNSFGVAAYTNFGAHLAIRSGFSNPDSFFAPRLWLAPMIGIFCLLGIAICLRFMWDLRHPK